MPLILNDLNVIYKFHVLRSYHPIESQKRMERYEIDLLAIDINLYGINYLPKKYISTPLIFK